MRFFTVPSRTALSPGVDLGYLVRSSWDDYHFKTTFALFYYDFAGRYREIGDVKIGEIGLNGDDRYRPNLPDAFENFSSRFFSLGQDDSYYERLNGLDEVTRQNILMSLNDIAYDLDIFSRVVDEPVTGKSLLRFVSMNTVQNQFNRMAHGGARLSAYSFSYVYPLTVETSANDSLELSFSVAPESQPPTNVHVIIGANGVGKSRLLNHIIESLVKSGTESEIGGVRFGSGGEPASTEFANLISVAFSAFDDFTPYSSTIDKSKGMPFTYIGLKRTRTSSDPDKPSTPKSTVALAREFGLSVKACVEGARLFRWRRALEMLESDPIFADEQITELADAEWVDEDLQESARELFHNLSSGHKIVLLTITRLVESIEERSLVLLDEPESHLHPPLLSAFIRALSDLLVYRNGAAIIATHSPVVLQEVPRSCVWKLRRFGAHVAADRPELETFGENVGILTQEVFGLEITKSGFHKMITESVESGKSYDTILQEFGGNLGSEAKALVQALIAQRDDRFKF